MAVCNCTRCLLLPVGVETEGLFRVSAEPILVNDLKLEFDQGTHNFIGCSKGSKLMMLEHPNCLRINQTAAANGCTYCGRIPQVVSQGTARAAPHI